MQKQGRGEWKGGGGRERERERGGGRRKAKGKCSPPLEIAGWSPRGWRCAARRGLADESTENAFELGRLIHLPLRAVPGSRGPVRLLPALCGQEGFRGAQRHSGAEQKPTPPLPSAAATAAALPRPALPRPAVPSPVQRPAPAAQADGLPRPARPRQWPQPTTRRRRHWRAGSASLEETGRRSCRLQTRTRLSCTAGSARARARARARAGATVRSSRASSLASAALSMALRPLPRRRRPPSTQRPRRLSVRQVQSASPPAGPPRVAAHAPTQLSTAQTRGWRAASCRKWSFLCILCSGDVSLCVDSQQASKQAAALLVSAVTALFAFTQYSTIHRRRSLA